MNKTKSMTAVIDKDWENRFNRNRFSYLNDKKVTEQNCSDVLPEEVEMALIDYRGDGSSVVGVSGDVAVNDYGTKYGAHVYVQSACGSKEEEISATHKVLRGLMEKFLGEDLEEMKKVLDSKKDGGSKEVQNVAGVPFPALTASTPPGKAPERKVIPSKTIQVQGKPNFRR